MDLRNDKSLGSSDEGFPGENPRSMSGPSLSEERMSLMKNRVFMLCGGPSKPTLSIGDRAFS